MDESWYMSPKEAWQIVIAENERFQDIRTVGHNGVTSLRRVPRDGMHSNIPYIEVWRGDVLAEEYCQHAIVGVLWVNPRLPITTHFRTKP